MPTSALRSLLITIDGPAGAGKTTVSKMLAVRLGYRYLDTGALYRAVAYQARAAGIRVDDDRALAALCQTLRLRMDGGRMLADGVDIGGLIRSPEIAMLASAVSARPAVRQALLKIQREMGAAGDLVAEGRDMGTVVFPDADLKFFLDASVCQRARRRFDQYGDTGPQTLEQIEADIRRRDRNDRSRAVAPLVPAVDALIIDSTAMTARAVVDQMMASVRSCRKRPGAPR